MSVSVSAVVLAAGESTRMGIQKAVIEWEGMPLLAYQLQQLADVDAVREIVVVSGHESERVREIASLHPRSTVVHNAAYRSGKVSSIVAGLRAVLGGKEEIMVLAVDQPRSAAALRAIIAGHGHSRAAITVPVHGGRRGHPTLFARGLLSELMAITEETMGLRAVLRPHAAEIYEVECDASVLVDLNVPGDVRGTSPDR